MTHHPIPADALDDRLGYFGTAGSGKTYNAGSGVERLLQAGKRCIIPDPLGVWWGLRLSADGKVQSGFNVVIFGGPHGDLPLTEHVGALIGETVAGMTESCILDLSELGTKAAERRFMLAFLTALYKHATGEPMHVVFDEADMWAPQQIRDRDQEPAKLLGMMETIVRRGRVKGFVPWLISQRPAVLNKDVMSQIDGLVGFKLTSSQDRDALGDWVKGQADIGQWNEIWKSLPTLERGQGVVWLPARATLKTAHFPLKATFDSSRTPKRGERVKSQAKLRPLNLDKLRERMASVEEETKANDPRALKAQVAELEKKLKNIPQNLAPDPAAISAAEERGFERGKKEIAAAADKRIREARLTDLEGLHDLVAPFVAFLEGEIKRAKADKAKVAKEVAFTPAPITRDIQAQGGNGAARPARLAIAPRRAAAAAGGDESLSGPEQRILNSLASWAAMGHEQPGNAQIAWLAGYSPTSTGYTNPRSGLRTKGLIDYPAPDRVALTADGAARATAMQLQGSLLETVLARLPGPERRILTAAAARHPEDASNEEVAADAGYSPTSTGYTNPRSALRTKELITYPSGGKVRAAEWLFG